MGWDDVIQECDVIRYEYVLFGKMLTDNVEFLCLSLYRWLRLIFIFKDHGIFI